MDNKEITMDSQVILVDSPVILALAEAYRGKRWDMKHYAARILESVGRTDASESVMFARELEYIYSRTFDVLYPNLKARTLIPVNKEVPTGADTHTYQQYDRVGEAKEVDDYAQDFPTAEVSGAQFTGKIVSLGSSYQYSTQDARNAAMAKKPLDAMKSNAARLAIEEKLEKIAALGSDARGITGLLNAPNVDDIATLPNGQWDTLLATPTDTNVAKVQADVQYMQRQIWVNSKTVHGNSGLTLLCDTTTYSLLAGTPQSPTFKDVSIKDFLLRTVPGLSAIDFWLQNDTSDAGGRQLMMYEKSPDVCELIIPQEFEMFPPQLYGMAFKIYCHMRTAGVSVRRPKACQYTNDHVG